jgi:meso-butanediol dehydrogenase / (S,S)-butanediol dehydrogenase / diacetyl reductase
MACYHPAVARFTEKTAIITGAASGMGRSIAHRLASEGASVFAVDIDAAGLAVTAEDIVAKGSAVETYQCDVSSRANCHAAVAAAVAAFGHLDILGNVAGIARAEHVADVTEEQWRQMFGVNVDAYFWMAQAAIPHLLASSGSIINIASNAGFMGQAYTVPYCTTKGAVVNLTRGLAMEFIKQPIRINAIAPGGVDTPLAQNFRVPDDVDFDLMMRYNPVRGMAQPEDIANLFAYLASDEARNIHGAIISSDGGVTAG